MTTYKCSECHYVTEYRTNLINHINKINKCSINQATIIEIKVDIRCEYCQNSYSYKKCLDRHIQTCKLKPDFNLIKEEVKEVKNQVKEKSRKSKASYHSLVRKEARKKFMENNRLICAHCQDDNKDHIQICHIKPVRDFYENDPDNQVNNLSNLIALCANCHLDLDKSKDPNVIITSLIHSFNIHMNYLEN
jgi:hypothetical protein